MIILENNVRVFGYNTEQFRSDITWFEKCNLLHHRFTPDTYAAKHIIV